MTHTSCRQESRRRVPGQWIAAMMLAFVYLIHAAHAAVPRYSVTEIDMGVGTAASSLTDNELIAGGLGLPGGGFRAFFYSDGVTHDLGTLGGPYSWAEDANDAGQVVGWALANPDIQRAFLFADGVMRDLGTLGGAGATATGINSSGVVTGTSGTAVERTVRGFIFVDGVMRDLGTLGGDSSVAYAINDHGQVTGMSDIADSAYEHAFLYSDGLMQDLGTMAGGHNSYGNDINERGQVTGTGTGVDSSGDYFLNHAFLYADGVMRDLGTLGGIDSYGVAVNDGGQVTGYSQTKQLQYRAFLYSDGTMHNLNDLIDPGDPLAPYVVLAAGVDINDQGIILASGWNTRENRDNVYLLRPLKRDGGGGSIDNWLLGMLATLGAMSRINWRQCGTAAGRSRTTS